jgi:hypothetical protein
MPTILRITDDLYLNLDHVVKVSFHEEFGEPGAAERKYLTAVIKTTGCHPHPNTYAVTGEIRLVRDDALTLRALLDELAMQPWPHEGDGNGGGVRYTTTS